MEANHNFFINTLNPLAFAGATFQRRCCVQGVSGNSTTTGMCDGGVVLWPWTTRVGEPKLIKQVNN